MPEIQTKERLTEDGPQTWLPPALALGTLLQYMEKLSDRQAEEASRLRVDWKYALHLPMYYPGLSRSVLCQFRQQVYLDPCWQEHLQSVLDRLALLDPSVGAQQFKLTVQTLMDQVCSQSRLEEIMLALRRALEALAVAQPQWLRANILPHWYTRYHLFNSVPDLPQDLERQTALSEAIGADILALFDAISCSGHPELEVLEEIRTLRRIWSEQFTSAVQGGVQRLARCSFCGSLKSSGENSE